MARARGPGRGGEGGWIGERGVVIGDPGFIAKLAAVLGIPRGGRNYPQEITDLGIVIAVDAGQVLSGASRLSVASITDELFSNDTETVLGPIVQGANANQLNQDLMSGLNAGDAYELLGMTLWARLNNPAAGDQAQVTAYIDETVRGAFPARGIIAGGIHVTEFFLSQPDKLTDERTYFFPGGRRGKVLSTTQGRVLEHFKVFNVRQAVGSINVGVGGTTYFRKLT